MISLTKSSGRKNLFTRGATIAGYSSAAETTFFNKKDIHFNR